MSSISGPRSEVRKTQTQRLGLVRHPKRSKRIRWDKTVAPARRFRTTPGPNAASRFAGDLNNPLQRQSLDQVFGLKEGCLIFAHDDAIKTEIERARQAALHDNRNFNFGKTELMEHKAKGSTMDDQLIEEIRKRIRSIKDVAPHKTQGELAKQLGIGRTAVNNIGAGRRDIKARELPILTKYLEIEEVFPFLKSDKKLTMLPIAGIVQAGVWREPGMDGHNSAEFPAFPTERYNSAPQYLLELRGESMNRHYRSGDIIYCVPIEHVALRDGLHVHVERTSASGLVEATLKALRIDGDKAELWPDSTDERHQEPIVYDDQPDSSVEIKGVVIGSFRPAP